MIKETYEFILEGRGVDYRIYWIISESAKSALIKVCSLQGIEGVVARAIEALDLHDAIELANKFLEWEIVDIHTIGDVLYDNPKNNIEEIDITDGAKSQNGDITEGI